MGSGLGMEQAAEACSLRAASCLCVAAEMRHGWIGKWKLGLHLGIYLLDKWAGPKGYLGQNLCMVRVRVHPRVKVENRTRIHRV